MAFRFLARRSLLATGQSLTSALSHSSSSLSRLRPLAAAASTSYFGRLVPGISARTYLTEDDIFSIDEAIDQANFSPKEPLMIEGCDFEHWFVLMDDPEGDLTRDELIDTYIKTLAKVVGSEEEARMKIYSVSTRYYYAFGAAISKELSKNLEGLPGVRWVLPDSYLDPTTKNYGGEPFINGEAVPYDPKYHQDWLKTKNRRDNSGPNAGEAAADFGGLFDVSAYTGPTLVNLGGQFEKDYGNMDQGYENLNHLPSDLGQFGFKTMYNNQNNFVPDVVPGLRLWESDSDTPQQNEDLSPPPNC